jgi:hypothetical protein
MTMRRTILWWIVPMLAIAALVACSTQDRQGSAKVVPYPTIQKESAGFLAAMVDTADPVTSSYGYGLVDATPGQLFMVSAGQRALVWLGGYDNARCRWETDDAGVREAFAGGELARSGKVAGYFIADEPNSAGGCPAAAGQVRARAALVRKLDSNPAHFTLVNVDDPHQFAAFRNSADVMATDPYPCHVGKACDWSQIPSYVGQLRAAGVVRYMGMLQAFSGGDWRWPTAAELTRMIGQWQQSEWIGELTFSWSYAGNKLADHPELLAVLRRLNA